MRMAWLLALLLAFAPAFAYGPDTIGSTTNFFSSEVVNPNATATSSAWTKLGNTKNQAVLLVVTGSGGSPAVALEIQGSFDNTNFYPPTVGNTVTSVTANGGVIAPLATPPFPYARFKLYNTSSSVTATCSVDAISQ